MGRGVEADAGPGWGKEGWWAPGWSQMSGHEGEPQARRRGCKQEPLLPVWNTLQFCGCTGEGVVNSAPDLGCRGAGKICGLGWVPWGGMRVPWVEEEGLSG